ncbi:superoxide dismutase[Cu-Zn] [Mycobacterium sp. SMC-4]|uniref:superoxide dismutase[Cu-Zn] n=1 Tax=Mycobacterium sp. SMC-4 TaxID=2857059 RepID=UPI003D00C474
MRSTPVCRTVVATLFAAPALALSACSPPGEVPSDSPGTTPPIWTGSPAPTTEAGDHGSGHGGGAAAASGETLSADIRDAEGATVATAEIQFTDGYATVTVETTGQGQLTPGFHGLHIHSVGKCETDSVSPTGGAPADFNSAGGHYHTSRDRQGHPASGDLTALQIRSDGNGRLVTTTDAFTAEDLLADGGTAIMIHEKPDNYSNIPPERYQQINGDPPPDQTTLDTGDAGARVACGVIGRG